MLPFRIAAFADVLDFGDEASSRRAAYGTGGLAVIMGKCVSAKDVDALEGDAVSGSVPNWIRTQDRLAILLLLYVIVANAVRGAIPDYLPSNAFTRWVAGSAALFTWVLWIALAGWVIGRIVDLYGPGDGYFARTSQLCFLVVFFVLYFMCFFGFVFL